MIDYPDRLHTLAIIETNWQMKDYDERDSEEIRKLILDTLHEIRDNISIDFDIEVIQNTEFGEDIVMRLHPESTGIQNFESEKEGATFQKKGAKIVFNQIYSNGSEVSYRMSHIEGLTDKPKTELKDKAPREHISRKYIMEKVLAFLQEVVKFEK